MLVNIWGSNKSEKRVVPQQDIEVFAETDIKGVLL